MKYKAYKYLLNEDETFSQMLTYLNTLTLKKYNRGINLSNCDLRFSNLNDSNLHGCDLSNSNLSGCSLINSHLNDCNLSNSNLRFSNLSKGDFSNSNLHGCDFSNSNLNSCNLSNCDLGFSVFKFSNLSNSNLCNSILNHSCLPLQCSTQNITIDKNNLQQLLKMILSSNCDWETFKQFQEMKIYKALIGD